MTQPIAVPQGGSSKKGLWIGLATAAVLVVTVGGWAVYTKMMDPNLPPASVSQDLKSPGSTATEKASDAPQPAKPESQGKADVDPTPPEPARLLTPRGQRIEKALKRAESRNETRNAVAAAAPAADAPSGQWSQGDIPVLLARGDTYLGRGEYQKAIFVYEQVLRIDPSNARARLSLQRARDARSLRR